MRGFLKNSLLVIGGVVVGSIATQKAIIHALDNKKNSVGLKEQGREEVLFSTREDADKVLDEMESVISTYGSVSLADFYDLASIEPKYTDNRFGWTNLNGAKVIRKLNGYLIEFPRIQSIT